MNKPINNPETKVSTLIERLRIGVAEFPIIIEHPSLLMNEAADRLEELETQLALLGMTKEAWRMHKDQAANQCVRDVQAILDGDPPQALEKQDG